MNIKARMIVSMKNQMSRFLYLWNAGRYDEIPDRLLSRKETFFSFPDKGIELHGYDEIYTYLTDRRYKEELQTVHYLNSPSVSVAENGSESKGELDDGIL